MISHSINYPPFASTHLIIHVDICSKKQKQSCNSIYTQGPSKKKKKREHIASLEFLCTHLMFVCRQGHYHFLPV